MYEMSLKDGLLDRLAQQQWWRDLLAYRDPDNGQHFFVEVIWVPAYVPQEDRRGSAMEVIGSPENLARIDEIQGDVHKILSARQGTGAGREGMSCRQGD